MRPVYLQRVEPRKPDLPHLSRVRNHPRLHRCQLLGKLRVKDPFKKLGQKIMVQSTTMYLLVSSQLQAARQILREGLSLLFGQFEILEMGPLDPVSSLRTVRSVWTQESADPFLESLLVELAQGYPSYLSILLQGVGGRPLPRLAEDRERVLLDLLESLLLDRKSTRLNSSH